MQETALLGVEKADNTTALDELLVWVFVEVAVHLDLELGSQIRHIHFALRSELAWRLAPVHRVGRDLIDALEQIRIDLAFEAINP